MANRQRAHAVMVRLDDTEYRAVRQAAQAVNERPAAWLRHVAVRVASDVAPIQRGARGKAT